MEKNNILMEVSNVKQHFKIKTKSGTKALLKAVDGVSFNVFEGETFGIVGESGCGKSTLGKTLLKLYPVTEGQILFEGKNIDNLKGKDLKQYRSKTQMIFQDPSACLNPRRTIIEIMLEPFIIHNLYTQDERIKKVKELCNMVGLSEAQLEKYPHQMSGGQKQRVGIARAIALNPKLIVCDEPISALDVSIQAQVINLLDELQKNFNLTYIFISHNLSVVKLICERIAVMYLGEIVELTTSKQIYENPSHPYTNALISAIPSIDKDINKEVLSGELPSPINPPSGCRFHARCPKVMDICKTQRPQLKEISKGHFVSCLLY